MPQLEATQVKLRLVTEKDELPGDILGKEVLAEMKKPQHKKLWQNDEQGKYISIMFDGMMFKFRPGKALTVGKVIANALRRSSALMIGPDYLNGPIAPMLVVEKEFTLGEENSSDTESLTQTTCPVCRAELSTLPKLVRHIEKHKRDHPELFNEPDGLPWEGEGKIANPIAEADGSEDDENSGDEAAG